MPIFTLTINSRTPAFGESVMQERNYVAQLLGRAAQQIDSRSGPLNAQNVPEPAGLNPTNCQWAFGAGSISEPCNPKTGTSAGGTAVTIKGIGFKSSSANVSFGGAAATSVVVVDDATITCTTPAHGAGLVDVVVGSPGTQTLAGAFTFT